MGIQTTTSGKGLIHGTPPSTVTVCAWVRRLGSGAVGTGGGANEVETALALSEPGSGYQTAIGWNTVNANYGYEYQWSSASFTNQPSSGDWVFLALTQTSTTSAYFYLGRLSDSTLEEDGPFTAHDLTPDELVVSANAWGGWFNGEFAHLKVWNSVLTKAQLEQEFWSVRPATPCTFFWNPLFSTTNQLVDFSGNGNTFTQTGTTADGTAPPVGYGVTESGLLVPAGSLTMQYVRPIADIRAGNWMAN